MPRNLKEFLAPYLKKIGMEDGKVAALFNADGTELTDNAEAELTTYDATRITTLKTAAKTEGFDQGHQKGLSEGATKWETQAREKYALKDSTKKGLELVDEIVSSRTAAAGATDDDKVKVHPLFVKMENDLKKKITDTETTWKTKHEKYQQEVAREKTYGSVMSKADALVTALKPVLPKDPAKAAKQKQTLFNDLKGFEFTEVDGNLVVLKDGKAHEDAHGNKIAFNDLVKGLAESIWDFETGTTKTTAGNNNNAGAAGGTTVKVVAPKTEGEYVERMKAAKTPDERIAIDDAWSATQTAGTN